MAAQIPLIWITAAVVLALLILAATIFVKVYQDRREKDAFVTTVCILALTCLLATVCLFPVDIALVSSTTDNSTGLKKHWASPETVHNILVSLRVVYYMLYSVDAVMCLLIIPFAYFWYEEWDQDTTTQKRLTGALKYSVFFVALLVVLLLVGLFVPVATETKGHLDLDYFKKLLMENHGERALTFITGVLMCFGTVLFVIYTAPGLALTPMVLIKSIPTSSLPALTSGVHEALAINRERQRAIELRYSGGSERPNSRDRRELESLQREERTLVRRQRIAEENDSSRTKKAWHKLQAIGRPFKILLGLLILVITILIFASTLITGIDKILNSPCGKHCGYILPNTNILNPVNWVFVQASKVFPVDYVLALALVLLFFVASIVGVAFIGIRFLWVSLFRLRVSSTKPQGLLLSTVMLTLIVLALNYFFTMLLFPQYAHYGGQQFCDHTLASSGLLRNCTGANEIYIRPCDETAPQDVCTPTVVSSFINRITLNFPFFGLFAFWAQFAFMGVFVLVTLTGLVWTPRLGSRAEEDEAAEAEEEEGLLAGTGRRTRAAWEDLTGRRVGVNNGRTYGTSNDGGD
ncbi:LMBR1-like membrane protein-domain-containing protein [Geopyxis carbonaria]|nr:LMBR1-like membrane protein-domain-containing protein [Geopyxis carbonaria]